MVQTTPVNGWPLAESSDDLSIEDAIGALAADIDDDLLPVMTTATRNATIVPSEGMLSYVTDRKTMEIFDGTIWREADKTRVLGSADMVLPDTTLRDIPGLSYKVIADGLYYFDGIVSWSASAADDIRFKWDLPSGTSGRWLIASNGNISTDVTTQIALESGGTAHASHFIGYFQITTTGTCKLQVSKVADTSIDEDVFWRGVAWNFTRLL